MKLASFACCHSLSRHLCCCCVSCFFKFGLIGSTCATSLPLRLSDGTLPLFPECRCLPERTCLSHVSFQIYMREDCDESGGGGGGGRTGRAQRTLGAMMSVLDITVYRCVLPVLTSHLDDKFEVTKRQSSLTTLLG